jgi:hypothetical protein
MAVRVTSERLSGSRRNTHPIEKDWIGVAMGSFELPTGTRVRIHIHVADKGDYYNIVGDLPQSQH